MTAADVERLGASRFVSLTTYRRDRTPVSTPVWVVRDGSHLLVWTGKRTGKASGCGTPQRSRWRRALPLAGRW